ncbi:hypothetical protein AU193_07870 [Mycobacterium sp. GA-1285]|uniref:type II toxin-antitoxin system VapC family toxin n=1 Tax=Mycobacterium sp. GA-1285 TaxID=1772282 RepID=UPI000749BA73|nr:type II toxin-antitoxin system VapC family toxin [Mycobacterium sp. GA-1285]KUI19803.1 hypothetical protein AU193_07870 [Mycobacterium sp. GA-1285]
MILLLGPSSAARIVEASPTTRDLGQAHIDLLDLAIDYWPCDVLADCIWELRENLSSYDGAYVALAENLNATLVTLDRASAVYRA